MALPLLACAVPAGSISSKTPTGEVLKLMALPVFAYLPGWFMFRGGLCKCSEMGSIFWFVLMVVPAVWLGLAIFLVAMRIKQSSSKVYLLIAACPFILAIVSSSVLWLFPQKRMNSLFLGFLHGPIYDRWIALDAGVVMGRFGHALLGLMIITAALGNVHYFSRRFFAMMVLPTMLVLVSWVYDSGGHGMGALKSRLTRDLSNSKVVVHFQATKDFDERLAALMLDDATFHVREIEALLDMKIPRPIHIFAYKNREQKKILFGGGDTDITDVWSPSVHIELLPAPHPTLRHELVHAVASFISWNGIGFHPNMLLTEGLAMAFSPVEQDFDFDVVAASLLRSGQIQSVSALGSPFEFWQQSGPRAYYVAGSLLRWLQSQFGSKTLRDLYSGKNFAEATGLTADEIVKNWSQYVHQQFDDRQALVVERFTREPGVLQDICPHSLEDLSRPSDGAWLTRLRQPLGWSPARLNQWSQRIFPNSKQLIMEELDELMTRKIGARTKDLDVSDILARVESIRDWPPKTIEDIRLVIFNSDVEHLIGRTRDASSRLIDLTRFFSAKDPGDFLRRQVEVRLAIDEQVDSLQVASKWRQYVAGWLSDLPDSRETATVLNYLRARRISNPEKVVLDGWMMDARKISRYPRIQREWFKMIAKGYSQKGFFMEADQVYRQLSAMSYGEAKRIQMEHSRRMVFLDQEREGE